MISFQCEPGFSLVGGGTFTCNNSGLWYPDPALFMCISMLQHLSIVLTECLSFTITSVGLAVPVDIAPIAGGVVGGLIAVIVVVLTVIVLVVFLVWRVKGEAAMMCVQCAVMSALVV